MTVFLILVGASLGVQAKPDTRTLNPQDIKITATPMNLDRKSSESRQYGKLVWLGGISLTSKSPYFGGYSGLAIDEYGKKIISVSDSGSWLSAELGYDSNGRINGLNNAHIGPLLAKNGKHFNKKTDMDAEGITLADGGFRKGIVYVSFEINNRIAKYSIKNGFIKNQRGQISLPRSARKRRKNKGLEGLTKLYSGPNKGRLVVFAERYQDPEDFLNGWLIGKRGTRRLKLRRLGGFDITDLASLPDGGLLILERRFRYTEGIKMRIRRIRPIELETKKYLDGEVLFEADDSYNIDNMEGIAVHKNGADDLIITLISDDNFNLFQRTLLMQFKLPSTIRR